MTILAWGGMKADCRAGLLEAGLVAMTILAWGGMKAGWFGVIACASAIVAMTILAWGGMKEVLFAKNG